MMADLVDWSSALLLIIGLSFAALSAIGILRMPDSMMRLLATSKAPTLGIICIYLAVALQSDTPSSFFRAILVIAFTLVTIPAAAHALGLALYRTRSPLWPGTRFPPEKEGGPEHDSES